MKLEDIKGVGIVGAGAMGFGIAINFALWGYPLIISDTSERALQRAVTNTQSAMNMFVEEKLISHRQADECIQRIKTTTNLVELAARSDFVTEAIIERAEDKRELFNKLDKMCPPHTIVASNTSSLVLGDFASDVSRQDKVVITHYFSPAHIVPGVEVGKGYRTSEETFDITYDLMKKIRKVPIRVLKERHGCLLSRIQRAMDREVFQLWAEGVATADDIELGIRSTFGFRMPNEGSMMHHDLSGIWRWPRDARLALWSRDERELSTEAADIIRERMVEDKPWFVDPNRLDDEIEKRDRTYVRRLKELYWSKEDWLV